MTNYDNPYEYEELPFNDDWGDEDRAYDEMRDEQVLAEIAEQRCAELTRKVRELERENRSLRKMLSAAALVGKQGW